MKEVLEIFGLQYVVEWYSGQKYKKYWLFGLLEENGELVYELVSVEDDDFINYKDNERNYEIKSKKFPNP